MCVCSGLRRPRDFVFVRSRSQQLLSALPFSCDDWAGLSWLWWIACHARIDARPLSRCVCFEPVVGLLLAAYWLVGFAVSGPNHDGTRAAEFLSKYTLFVGNDECRDCVWHFSEYSPAVVVRVVKRKL